MSFLFGIDDYLKEMEVKYYDFEATRAWTERVIPFVLAAVVLYLTLAFLGVRWMKEREKYDLRRTLVVWNVALAWFSFIVAYRITPHVFAWIWAGEWTEVVCSLKSFQPEYMGVWSFLFTMSKLFEFGDTVFIVLKKKKLIFLHWYHHITVLLYCWFGFADPTSLGKIFGLLNSYVHAVMYTYYAVSASGLVKIPRRVNLYITTMQLSQMIVGIVATFAAFYQYTYHTCGVSRSHLWAAFAMYGSYTLLFMNFFYQTYLAPKPKAS